MDHHTLQATLTELVTLICLIHETHQETLRVQSSRTITRKQTGIELRPKVMGRGSLRGGGVFTVHNPPCYHSNSECILA